MADIRLPPAAGGPARHPANGAWEALLSAHASLMREFAADDVWEDLAVKEYDVLYTLSKCPQPIRLGELNRHVLLSQPALSRLVDRLVERELVSRAADPRDGRGVGLALTPAGLATQRRIGRGHGRAVAKAMGSRLTPLELRQLEVLCGKLAEPAPVRNGQSSSVKLIRKSQWPRHSTSWWSARGHRTRLRLGCSPTGPRSGSPRSPASAATW